MRTIAFHNLGCKVNAYETDAMMQNLQKKGWRIVPFDERADVYVVNTCTVTNIADRKSRQMLHRAKKTNPDAVVVAVGCYVETDREGVKKDPSIDLAVGTMEKGHLAEIVENYLREREIGADGNAPAVKETSEEIPEERVLSETRADVKIQDGCNQFCSYCIIPYARGRVRSRRPEEVLDEISSLAGRGVREVILTGIHIGSYGLDWRGVSYNQAMGKPGQQDTSIGGNQDLLHLILQAAKIPGIQRIRLGSLEPRVMSENFIAAIAAEPKICPHFHLSLQSGCNSVLRRMNRHYSAEEFMETVERLRRYYDRPALTTDVIVGFPGETEKEFEESRRFLEEVNFYEIHVFKYSRRHGTVADAMPDQIQEAVKEQRSRVLQEMTMRQARAYRESFVGEDERILPEDIYSADQIIHRTQMAYDRNGEKPASGETGEKENGIFGRRFLAGHTSRYLPVLIPAEQAEELKYPYEGECRVHIESVLPDVPWCLGTLRKE